MRTHICDMCGELYDTLNAYSTHCPDCTKKVVNDAYVHDVECKTCGAKLKGTPATIYCKECAKKRQNEINRAIHKYGANRPLGSKDYCEACGKEYIVRAGTQKYCRDCARQQAKLKERERKKAYAKEYVKTHKKRIATKACIICGKPFLPGTASVTCSPECKRENKRRTQIKVKVAKGQTKQSKITWEIDKTKYTVADKKGICWENKTWYYMFNGKKIDGFKDINSAIASKKENEKEGASK